MGLVVIQLTCFCINKWQVLIATFAISSYASTITRSAHKPFNPLLGETYECVRDDKGWKFVAEQVTTTAL